MFFCIFAFNRVGCRGAASTDYFHSAIVAKLVHIKSLACFYFLARFCLTLNLTISFTKSIGSDLSSGNWIAPLLVL